MILVPALLILAAPAPTDAQKIESLIQAVANLRGAVFIRNGSEHSPREAADHLRLKWKNAGGRVKTAPDFIRFCATGSSLSGKPYQIRLENGRTVPARDWLWSELKRMKPGD
jgi:transketolase C-terminal domain/subunit